MGRIQKKKTEGQKVKQKARQKTRTDLQTVGNDSGAKKDASIKTDKVKRLSTQKKSTPAKNDKKKQEPGIIDKISSFLREVKAELKKVVWPPRNQTITSTIVVVVLVIIVSSFLGLFDFGLKGLIRMVLH